MARASNRDRILAEGFRVVHERGFIGASVRGIVEAAGVPQGSFTNHFASKEDFCLEVLDIYVDAGRAVMQDTLLNTAREPLNRIAAYVRQILTMSQNTGSKTAFLSATLVTCSLSTSPWLWIASMRSFISCPYRRARCMPGAARIWSSRCDCYTKSGQFVLRAASDY